MSKDIRAVPSVYAGGRKKISLEEYLQLPEGPPYYEYEDGEAILMPAPHGNHQIIGGELYSLISTHLKKSRHGRVWPAINVILPNGRHYIPDLVYLAREHLERYLDEDGKIHGTPDLVIEILSQNRARDEVKKFTIYQDAGVPWYWIIDAIALTIEEYRLTPDGYLRASTVDNGEDFRPHLFEGLVINLAQLLKDLIEGENNDAA